MNCYPVLLLCLNLFSLFVVAGIAGLLLTVYKYGSGWPSPSSFVQQCHSSLALSLARVSGSGVSIPILLRCPLSLTNANTGTTTACLCCIARFYRVVRVSVESTNSRTASHLQHRCRRPPSYPLSLSRKLKLRLGFRVVERGQEFWEQVGWRG